MSMMKSALPLIENALATIEVLAASECPTIPQAAGPEAVRVIADGLSSRYAQLVGACQTLAVELKHAKDVLADLQLSSEPEVERLAAEIFVHVPNTTKDIAYARARDFIAYRTAERLKKPSGKPSPTIA